MCSYCDFICTGMCLEGEYKHRGLKLSWPSPRRDLNLGFFEFEPEELLIPKRPVFSVFFRRFSVSSEKRVLDSPYMTARISAAATGTDFREIWYCGLVRKSVTELEIWVKSDNIGHFK